MFLWENTNVKIDLANWDFGSFEPMGWKPQSDKTLQWQEFSRRFEEGRGFKFS